MPAYTAQELIDRAKAAADMHDNFVTPSTWLSWLTQEKYALTLFTARSGWPLDFETLTIDVVGDEAGEFTLQDEEAATLDLADHFTVTGLNTVIGRTALGLTADHSITFIHGSGTGLESFVDGVEALFTYDAGVTTVSDFEDFLATSDYFTVVTAATTQGALIPVGEIVTGSPEPGTPVAAVYPLVVPDLDVMAIISVHQVASNGQDVRRVKYNDAVTFLRQLSSSPRVTTDSTMYYRVRRNGDSLDLNFYPNPAVGCSFLVTYIPAPSRATVVTDSISYPMGWEERIVLGMARRALEKEESDSAPILRRIAEIDQQIEELCWSRVISESPTVRNTDGRSESSNFPPWSEWAWL